MVFNKSKEYVNTFEENVLRKSDISLEYFKIRENKFKSVSNLSLFFSSIS